METSSLRLAFAQLNPVVGDISGNVAKVLAARQQAGAEGAELVAFPEVFLSGAPLQALALSAAFQDACRRACEELARLTADGGPALLLGLPWRDGGVIYNACALLDGGMIQSVRFKAVLASRGIRDETALFARGPLPGPVPFRDKIRLGLAIGEDILGEEVAECLAETGAELLLAVAALPYRRDVDDARMNMLVARSVETGLPLALLNQVGGQDGLVFDGASLGLNADRGLAFQLPAFREALSVTEWRRVGGLWHCEAGERAPVEAGDEADYTAIMLGLRDHVGKTGARGAILARDGSLEAELCAALAVDALGSESVAGVMLVFPARSETGAGENGERGMRAFASALGIEWELVSLPELPSLSGWTRGSVQSESAPASLADQWSRHGSEALLGLLAERSGKVLIQSGGRAGWLLGEPRAGFAPLRDVGAAQVARLAALRNRWKPETASGPDGAVVLGSSGAGNLPSQTLAPAAEDARETILDLLTEQHLRVSEVIARGHDAAMVRLVSSQLDSARSRRGRGASGVLLRASSIEGGPDYPVANRFADRGEAPHQAEEAMVGKAGRAGAQGNDF